MGHTLIDPSDVFEDAARLAAQKGLIRFTRFLDPAQAAQAARIARTCRADFSVWGGYPDAERVIGCFFPEGETVELPEYPVACLHARLNARFNSISHRDLLGAFMALGLTRACIGDIILSDTDAYLFAAAQTAGFIASSLTSAGKASLHFSVLDEVPDMPAPSGTAFSAIVSSLRLDAVLSAAYRLSRSESADCIRAGLVKVDHVPCERVDFQLREGSLLSLRGKGRVRLSGVNGLTRKQRIGIILFRYE